MNPEAATNQLIDMALAEDLGGGDVTVECFVPDDARCRARIVCRQEWAVVAGAEIARDVFLRLDPDLEIGIETPTGMKVARGDEVLAVSGKTRAVLSGERTALNFLQRLSGTATLTREYVDAIAGTRARILDTRKTTPGWRFLEKAAVRAGGGVNHRMGLYDMAMVKDNHLAAGAWLAELQEGIDRIRKGYAGVRVELEADTLGQVDAFMRLDGVDVILLDNMSCEEMRRAVERVAGRIELEASGGVNLATVAGIAATGVDFISVGALTHSAPAVDFSMEVEEEGA